VLGIQLFQAREPIKHPPGVRVRRIGQGVSDIISELTVFRDTR